MGGPAALVILGREPSADVAVLDPLMNLAGLWE